MCVLAKSFSLSYGSKIESLCESWSQLNIKEMYMFTHEKLCFVIKCHYCMLFSFNWDLIRRGDLAHGIVLKLG